MTLTEQQKHYIALVGFIGFMLVITPFAIVWAFLATIAEILSGGGEMK